MKKGIKITEMLDNEMSVPRQVHRANNEAATALEYYRSNYTVQFMIICSNGRFSDENQLAIKLFQILPSYFHSQCEQPNGP